MPRHPIVGRFCENPFCRREIDPHRPKGTKFCDSSCRSEAFKVKTGEVARPTPAKALRRVPKKPHAPRAPTPYVVMRKRLDLGELIGGFEVVGFAAASSRARAIRTVAASSEYVETGDQLVAVPVKALSLHFGDGSKVAEAEPSWAVQD